MGQIKGAPEVLDDKPDFHHIGCSYRQISILDDVLAERHRQIEKGYTRQHDDEHTSYEMVIESSNRLMRLRRPEVDKRKYLIQAIAVLLAAVESIDRKAQA